MELALVKGKLLHDKRDSIAEREPNGTWNGRSGTETGTIKLPIMGPTGLDGKTEGLEERAEVVPKLVKRGHKNKRQQQ